MVENTSEKHSLFSKSINERKMLVDKSKKTYTIIPKHTEYILYINEFLELKKGLHNIFHKLRKGSGNDKLTFYINSRGGLVNEGVQFYNIIQEKFIDRTTAYLDNHGYSMGAVLFSMADTRIIYPHSELMYHNYSTGVIGKGGYIKDKIEHVDSTITKFFKELIVDKGFLTKKEFKKMLMGKDYWMDATELCKRGIATHVIVKGKKVTAKQYLKQLRKK